MLMAFEMGMGSYKLLLKDKRIWEYEDFHFTEALPEI